MLVKSLLLVVLFKGNNNNKKSGQHKPCVCVSTPHPTPPHPPTHTSGYACSLVTGNGIDYTSQADTKKIASPLLVVYGRIVLMIYGQDLPWTYLNASANY